MEYIRNNLSELYELLDKNNNNEYYQSYIDRIRYLLRIDRYIDLILEYVSFCFMPPVMGVSDSSYVKLLKSNSEMYEYYTRIYRVNMPIKEYNKNYQYILVETLMNIIRNNSSIVKKAYKLYITSMNYKFTISEYIRITKSIQDVVINRARDELNHVINNDLYTQFNDKFVNYQLAIKYARLIFYFKLILFMIVVMAILISILLFLYSFNKGSLASNIGLITSVIVIVIFCLLAIYFSSIILLLIGILIIFIIFIVVISMIYIS